MRYKVAFFDIDGTLLNDKKELQPETKRAVEQLAASGVKVAISTGRHPYELGDVIDQLAVPYQVTCNGALVTGPEGAIVEQPLAPAAVERLAELSAERGHPLVIRERVHSYSFPPDHPWIAEGLANFEGRVPPATPDGRLPTGPIYQILLFSPPEEDAFYQQAVPEALFIRFGHLGSDVGPAGVTKATGAKALLDHLGVSPAEAMAFGDGLNDIELLQFVGCGVAMGNAAPEVKAAARHVTRDCNEDGIAWFLEQQGLI